MAVAQDGIRDGTFREVPHLKATLLLMIGGLNFAAEWYSRARSRTARSGSPTRSATPCCTGC